MPVMTIDRAALRAQARERIRTARVPALRFTALFLAIGVVLDLIGTAANYMLGDNITFSSLSLSFSFIGVLVSLLATVLRAGYAIYCLGVDRGEETPYSALFDAFPFAGKVILLTLLQAVLIAGGFMLFIVPGVVLALTYSFALYHLCEDPDVGVLDALRRSRQETFGYKTQLFLLLAGFLPLLILVSLPVSVCEYYLAALLPKTLSGELAHTLAYGILVGCASLYLAPYIALSQIGFYRRVTAPPEEEPLAESTENEENRLE